MATKTIHQYSAITALDPEDEILVYVVGTDTTYNIKVKDLFNNTENIGLGTNAPIAPLHVYRLAAAASVRVESDGGDASALFESASGSDAFVRMAEAGVGKFVMGVDGSDSDKFKMGAGTASTPSLLTTPAITIQSDDKIIVGVDLYTAQGTWTPAVTGSGSNPTLSYGTRAAYYKKIGNIIFFTFHIPLNSASGGSGNIQVSLPTGTPAYVGTAAAGGTNLTGLAAADYVGVAWAWDAATAVMTLRAEQTNTAMSVGALGASTILRGSGFYFI